MAEETLLTAARRVVRFFNVDNTSGGGLISNETTAAIETLDRMVRAATERKRRLAGVLEGSKDAEANA